MPFTIRELSLEDQKHVDQLCETIWSGNDYVPTEFSKWVSDPLSITLGVFEAEELVAIGNIEKLDGSNIAWIQGLRVREEHRGKGHGTSVTLALIELARDMSIQHLWYATSSRNEASMKVAEKCGFHIADRTGYFRIYQPYPVHSQPSPSIIPMNVNPERLHELLIENPELVESRTFPLAWHFDFKTPEGLTRLLSDAVVKTVVDDSGKVQGLYCLIERQRQEETTAAFTVFATDRSVFVDIMSRMIDLAEARGADRAVFFLGPRVTEWAPNLGYVADEFIDRTFLLYELNPTK
ncbi:MAG: GNAT family N-acetyltransferase [Promethearchaeota archaeon]